MLRSLMRQSCGRAATLRVSVATEGIGGAGPTRTGACDPWPVGRAAPPGQRGRPCGAGTRGAWRVGGCWAGRCASRRSSSTAGPRWLGSDGLWIRWRHRRSASQDPAILRGCTTTRRSPAPRCCAEHGRGSTGPRATWGAPARALPHELAAVGGPSTPSDLGFYKIHRTPCTSRGSAVLRCPNPLRRLGGGRFLRLRALRRTGACGVLDRLVSSGRAHRDRVYPQVWTSLWTSFERGGWLRVNEAQRLWDECAGILRAQVSEPVWLTSFEAARPVSFDGRPAHPRRARPSWPRSASRGATSPWCGTRSPRSAPRDVVLTLEIAAQRARARLDGGRAQPGPGRRCRHPVTSRCTTSTLGTPSTPS